MIYEYQKSANVEKLTVEIANLNIPKISSITCSPTTVYVNTTLDLDSGEQASLGTTVMNHNPFDQVAYVRSIVQASIDFGVNLIIEFATENVLLGITQLGLTNHVRTTCFEVTNALSTGSLYDAITEIKAIDPSAFDSVILTPARVLAFRNKIETYLGVPLATEWNQ